MPSAKPSSSIGPEDVRALPGCEHLSPEEIEEILQSIRTFVAILLEPSTNSTST